MAERSKYAAYYIAFSVAGLLVLALGCFICCGGCVPRDNSTGTPEPAAVSPP